jgi:response regulator RpfG family c-di-GMP phosphodiesterase
MPDSSSKPILVVDDDPTFRGMLGRGLSDLKYDVVAVESVSEAKQRLRTGTYLMVLSDYEMGSETGIDLLNYVSEVYPDLPFIMLTGHDEVALARQAIRTGALDFLPKPFNFNQLARLIEQNKERYFHNREQTAQLTHEILSGTIRALVTAVDAKDPYTATHSERVTQIAMQFGKALRLSENQLGILEFAALLHDVGKIAIPDSILRKPGKLDDDEFNIVKRHPIRSAEIICCVESLDVIATIVRHHHERWDGRGYPDHISGEAISLLSRIITLADVFEALTSDRSYRSAMPLDEVRRIIYEGLGQHFDPVLGEAFLMMDNI